LNLRTSFTLDRRNGKETAFTPPVHGADRNDWGSAFDIRDLNTLLVFDNVLTYRNTFEDRHNFEGMAGASWTDSKWSESYIHGTHFKDPYIQTLNAANRIAWDNTGTNASEWAIMSMFGRLSYNYDSKYLFTFNVRGDGSSKLHPDHRWGVFPSLSGAWRLSSENFMQDISWVDDLKIRGAGDRRATNPELAITPIYNGTILPANRGLKLGWQTLFHWSPRITFARRTLLGKLPRKPISAWMSPCLITG